MTRRLAVLLAAAALTGCGNPLVFHDDLDLNWDFGVLLTPSDTVHTPYVQGTSVRITADARRAVDGWTLESLDPEVLALDQVSVLVDPDGLLAIADAVGAGVTDLVAYDEDGTERDRVEIEVRAPTRVELHAAGARFAGLDDGESLADSPQVLVDGLATFHVEYWDGPDRLFGNGVLSSSPDADLQTEEDTTYLFENREWIRFTPHAEGPLEVQLYADGIDLGTTVVTGVTASAVTRVDIVGTSEAGADEGDSLVLLAQAWDADDVAIYGIDYAWDRDGTAEEGLGDLYRYTYDPTQSAELTATFDEASATVTVHGDGYVDTSNDIGCDHAGAPSPAWGLLALLALRRRVTRATGDGATAGARPAG